jgi:hypothetical protein
MHYTRNVKGKIVQRKLQKTQNLRALLPFATETRLGSRGHAAGLRNFWRPAS